MFINKTHVIRLRTCCAALDMRLKDASDQQASAAAGVPLLTATPTVLVSTSFAESGLRSAV